MEGWRGKGDEAITRLRQHSDFSVVEVGGWRWRNVFVVFEQARGKLEKKLFGLLKINICYSKKKL